MTHFAPIPADRFQTFHRSFQGDTWDICERCGGKCEINKIGSLMPGEAEFIAAARGESTSMFRATYLDGIQTPYGVIDVLKLKPGCPFLSADFRCTIKDVKVVLCEVYPVVFEVSEDGVVNFFLDEWCPIVRYVPELASRFDRLAIPALRELDVPADWYRAVELYDSLCVDYEALYNRRKGDPGYHVVSLDDVRECVVPDQGLPQLSGITVHGRELK